MVRVRLTGEECEVDRKTFRLLRAEEKRLRRERMLEKGDGVLDEATKRPLLLDIRDTDEERTSWHIDPRDYMEESILNLVIKEFWDGLTATQREMYRLVIVNGLSYRHCADICGVTYQAVQKSIQQVRKKAKSFFG